MRAAAVLSSLSLAACSVWARYTTPGENCHNERDDDLDGRVDCYDPECACEEGFPYCSDHEDTDRDGLIDAEEVSCWPWSDAVAPLDPHPAERIELRARRPCSSSLRSSFALTRDDWSWSGGAFESGPVTLEGGPQCSGLGVVTETCQTLSALRPVSGGACWSVSAAVGFPDQSEVSELDVVLAPDLGDDRPPLGAPSALTFGVRRVPGDGGARLQLRAWSDGQLGVEPAPPIWLVETEAPLDEAVRLTATTGDEDCDLGQVSIELTTESGQPLLSLDSVSPPESWRESSAPGAAWNDALVLYAGLQTAAPGAVQVLDLALERERFDPCGFPVPQLTGAAPGDDDAPAVVLAAARGGGHVCAVGATLSGPTVEHDFIPHRDQASPPELGPEDPAPPSQVFASWRTEDRGLDSFGLESAVEGPRASPAFLWPNVRAAALTWNDEVGFEGVLLVSSEPRSGGLLVRARSARCDAEWAFEPLTSLAEISADVGRPLHPLLLEIDPETLRRRLVLAEPGEGYAGHDDLQTPDIVEPEARFRAADDEVPFIKPAHSECIVPYPRAGLWVAESDDGEVWSHEPTEAAALPALERWSVLCGDLGDLENLPARSYPAAVTQLLEAGGFSAFVASGQLGVEVVVDREPDAGSDGDLVVDGTVIAGGPLLAPSRRTGAFDEGVVRDGHLLLLDAVTSGVSEGLLFYRGFRARRVLEGHLVAYEGGVVGVVPVRLVGANGDTASGDAGTEE